MRTTCGFVTLALIVAMGTSAFGQPYINGPLITHLNGTIVGQAGDASSLENALLPNPLNVFGYGGGGAIRLADDFTVPAGQSWTLSSVSIFGYTTGAVAVTATAGNYRIWCGRPGAPGSTILFDFSGANQMTAAAFTNIYRILNVTPATNRNIQRIDMNGNAILLSSGTYWLDMNYTGAGFTPPITILGQVLAPTGNAVQFFNAAWNPITSGTAAPQLQGLPFEINYTVGPPIPSQWQVNTAEASADFNGVQSTGCAGGVSNACIGSTVTATLASNLGFGWEAAVNTVPPLSLAGGGVATGGAQTLNIAILDPSTIFLNNLLFPPFPFPLGLASPAVIPFPMPPITLTVQFAVINPAHPDLISLSAAASVTGIVPTGTLPGPTLDEQSIEINLKDANLCATGGVTFFGNTYDKVYMASNGEVQFRAPGNDFSPTVAEHQADNPSIGFHMDLNPALPLAGGGCSVQAGNQALLPPPLQGIYPNPGTLVLCFRWFDVPIFGTTLYIRYYIYYIYTHAPGGGGIEQWVLYCELGTTSAIAEFLGMSPGNTTGALATNPGLQPYASGGASGPFLPTDMVYNFGAANVVWGTATAIVFSPNGPGGVNGYSQNGF